MTNYRRIYIPGSTLFFTLITYKRQKFLTSETARHCLKSAWRLVNKNHPFELTALVLLPDHLHCIWKLPKEDVNFSMRWSKIKKHFSKNYLSLSNGYKPQRTRSMMKRNESGLWQRRFWDHIIRNDQDFINHLNYIHYNPVKHGLVDSPSDWPYSTFHKYVKLDFYEKDWGSDPIEFDKIQNFGE